MFFLISMARAMTLDEAWQAAEANSREAELAHEQRTQSNQTETMAWAALSPKLSLAGNWTLNQRETAFDMSNSFPPDVLDLIETMTGEPVDFGEPLVINKKSYFDWNLSVIQPVFSGKAFPGLLGAKALVRAGTAQENAALAQLRLGVAQTWWAVRVAREGERVAGNSVDLAKRHLETAMALVKAGSATRQTELQARIALSRAERDAQGAHTRRVQVEEALMAVVGTPVSGDWQTPEVVALPYASVDDAELRAIEQRPDLLASSEQAKAAKMASLASKMGWLPDVNARFTEAFSENAGFSGENFNWMLTVGATWTLWDGGFRIADNAKTQSQARMADVAYDKAVSDTRVALRGAWQEHIRAEAALLTVQQELVFAEENLRLAEASFAAGHSTVLDAEDARVGRDSAQMSVLTETMNLHLSELKIKSLVGDL